MSSLGLSLFSVNFHPIQNIFVDDLLPVLWVCVFVDNISNTIFLFSYVFLFYFRVYNQTNKQTNRHTSIIICHIRALFKTLYWTIKS